MPAIVAMRMAWWHPVMIEEEREASDNARGLIKIVVICLVTTTKLKSLQ